MNVVLINEHVKSKIEVIENNSIQVRIANIIEKDGIEIAKTYHRHVVTPVDDISKEEIFTEIQSKMLWTKFT